VSIEPNYPPDLEKRNIEYAKMSKKIREREEKIRKKLFSPPHRKYIAKVIKSYKQELEEAGLLSDLPF